MKTEETKRGDSVTPSPSKINRARDMIEKYSDIVFGDSKYLPDNTDD